MPAIARAWRRASRWAARAPPTRSPAWPCSWPRRRALISLDRRSPSTEGFRLSSARAPDDTDPFTVVAIEPVVVDGPDALVCPALMSPCVGPRPYAGLAVLLRAVPKHRRSGEPTGRI